MSKRAALIAILVGVGVAAALAFWPGRKTPPQEIIQRNVLSMARSAEQRDLGEVMEHVSDAFRGPSQMGKDDLRRLLASQILRGTWVKVFVRDLQVDLESDTRARFRGRFVFGRSEGETLEELAKDSRIQAYEIDGDVVLEDDGEWRFVTGAYRTIPVGQLL